MRITIADLSVPLARSVAEQLSDVDVGDRVVLRVEAIVNAKSADVVDLTSTFVPPPNAVLGELELAVLPTNIEREG